MHNKNAIKIKFYFIIIDILSLVGAFCLAIIIRFYKEPFIVDLYENLLIVMVLVDLLLLISTNIYIEVIARNKIEELAKTAKHVFVNVLFTTLYLFLRHRGTDYSRKVVVISYFLYFVISLTLKHLYKNRIVKKARKSLMIGNKSLLLLCEKKNLKETVNTIISNNYDFYYICGICVIDEKMKGKKYKDFTIVANMSDILDYISTNWVDDILIATSQNNIPIHQIIDSNVYYNDRIQYISKLNEIDVITLVNKDYPFWQICIKKIVDILGGIVGSVITIVLIIFIGTIIYIKSPGPVIYTSNRVGENGKLFKFYKFRSMVLNADDLKKDLAKKNRNKDGMMFKIENDPRIIPGIGNFIRKTSLDEFPQFFNVLKGDMSLVGTRPPTLDEWNKYTPYYRSRLSIKPGITGMWQVSGRSEITDFNEVVKLDNEYIKNWSIWLDLKILVKTVLKLFSKDKGAM